MGPGRDTRALYAPPPTAPPVHVRKLVPCVHRRRNKATFNLSPINNVQPRRPPIADGVSKQKAGALFGVGQGGRGVGVVVVLDWDIISGSAHWATHVLVNVACVTDIWEALLIWFVFPATVCWFVGWTCRNKIRGMAQILIYRRCHPLYMHSVWKKKQAKKQCISSSVKPVCE